jgi:hypothetical protein
MGSLDGGDILSGKKDGPGRIAEEAVEWLCRERDRPRSLEVRQNRLLF